MQYGRSYAKSWAASHRGLHSNCNHTRARANCARTTECGCVAMLFSPRRRRPGGNNDMSNNDPRSELALSPMSALQIMVCTITVFLNALDGFDLLAISFATS